LTHQDSKNARAGSLNDHTVFENSSLFPYLGIERGYFLDIQHFFGEKKLHGFKVLCSICNLSCYYCHRLPFLRTYSRLLSASNVLDEMESWKPFNIVTLTGGEVTLVSVAAAQIMDILESRGVTTLFSTNGVLCNKVDYLTRHASLVKIDVKGSRRLYEKITGNNCYDQVLQSVQVCVDRLRTEVKILLHSFSDESDILSVLKDLEAATGFPDNMIVEFQLIRDFLRQGIEEPDAEKFKKICSKARPLPSTVLLKHYGDEEIIYKLVEGRWDLYRKKEVPLKFSWKTETESAGDEKARS